MRNYILYILTAILNYYPIVIFWGMSFAPIAFIGSVILFAVAAPLLMYYQKQGLIIGLIGCLLMIPYSFRVLGEMVIEERFKWDIFFIIIPTMLIIFSAFFTVKSLLAKDALKIPSKAMNKLVLAGIPLTLFIVYLLLFGKDWRWEMFKI